MATTMPIRDANTAIGMTSNDENSKPMNIDVQQQKTFDKLKAALSRPRGQKRRRSSEELPQEVNTPAIEPAPKQRRLSTWVGSALSHVAQVAGTKCSEVGTQVGTQVAAGYTRSRMAASAVTEKVINGPEGGWSTVRQAFTTRVATTAESGRTVVTNKLSAMGRSFKRLQSQPLPQQLDDASAEEPASSSAARETVVQEAFADAAAPPAAKEAGAEATTAPAATQATAQLLEEGKADEMLQLQEEEQEEAVLEAGMKEETEGQVVAEAEKQEEVVLDTVVEEKPEGQVAEAANQEEAVLETGVEEQPEGQVVAETEEQEEVVLETGEEEELDDQVVVEAEEQEEEAVLETGEEEEEPEGQVVAEAGEHEEIVLETGVEEETEGQAVEIMELEKDEEVTAWATEEAPDEISDSEVAEENLRIAVDPYHEAAYELPNSNEMECDSALSHEDADMLVERPFIPASVEEVMDVPRPIASELMQRL